MSVRGGPYRSIGAGGLTRACDRSGYDIISYYSLIFGMLCQSVNADDELEQCVFENQIISY